MRPGPTDALLAAVLLGGVLVSAIPSTDPFPWALLLVVVPLAWRRRVPTAVCVLVGLGLLTLLSRPMSQPISRPQIAIVAVAIAVAAASAASWGRWPWPGPAMVAAALIPVGGRLDRLPLATSEVPFLVLAVAALAGFILRVHIRSAAAAQALAVSADRARIARELHEAVTHRVALMVVAAGAARTLLPPDAERTAEQLRVVESGGREALAELQGLLRLLVPGDADDVSESGSGERGEPGAPRSPTPTPTAAARPRCPRKTQHDQGVDRRR